MEDRELVDAVLIGDKSAQRSFYDAHVDRVFALAYRMTGNETAAREATRELAAIVYDSDATAMQKAAVFALSRGDQPERTDHLIRIAGTHTNPEVVAAAFFWLAESPDERTLELFARISSNAGN